MLQATARTARHCPATSTTAPGANASGPRHSSTMNPPVGLAYWNAGRASRGALHGRITQLL